MIPAAIFYILSPKLNLTKLICEMLFFSKTYNGPCGLQQQLVRRGPERPPWYSLLIEALSVSANCWSLVRACLMTPNLTGSPVVINLMPLTTPHYGMYLSCCQMPCMEEALCGWWMMCYLCLCYVNQGGGCYPKPNGTKMRSAILACSIRLCWTVLERILWAGITGASIMQVQVSIQADGEERVMDWFHFAGGITGAIFSLLPYLSPASSVPSVVSHFAIICDSLSKRRRAKKKKWNWISATKQACPVRLRPTFHAVRLRFQHSGPVNLLRTSRAPNQCLHPVSCLSGAAFLCLSFPAGLCLSFVFPFS